MEILPESRTKKQRLISAFILLGMLSAGLVYYLSSLAAPYSSDSASYIEAARSMKAGQGLTISTALIDPVDQDTSPLALWPPGYPILICLLSLTGIDEAIAARCIPAVLYVFLPIAFFLVFDPLFKNLARSIPASIASAFMYSTVSCAVMAWSDIPFLFTSLLSLAFLFQALKRNSLMFILSAGLLSGCSLLIRNAGYALVFSVIAGLLAAAVFSLLPKKDMLKMAVLYCTGFAVAYLPYSAWCFHVFHSIQPYSMPPSELTFTANLKQYFWELSDAFLTAPAHSGIFAAVLGMALISSTVYLIRNRRLRSCIADDPHSVICCFTLIAYAVSGVLLVVISRSIYHWGEEINYRHLIQYNWVLVGYGAILFDMAYDYFPAFRKPGKRTYALIVLMAFLSVQFLPLSRRSRSWDEYLRNYYREIAVLRRDITLPRDDLVISNRDELIRIFQKRHVRHLDVSDYITPEDLAHKVSPYRDLTVVLFKNDIEKFPLWRPVFKGDIPPGYRSAFRNGNVIVLTRRKGSDQHERPKRRD